MNKIIDIHGQHDSQMILDQTKHIMYLDNFIGKEIEKDLITYQEKLKEYSKLNKELKDTYGEEQEKERKLDLLRYQLDEIKVAKLKETEETELEEKHKMMQNAEKLIENLTQIDGELNENAIGAISNAIRSLEKIQDLRRRIR